MSAFLNDTLDSSESLEDKANATEVSLLVLDVATSLPQRLDAPGWRWDSTGLWLVVVLVLLALLVLVNIFVYVKCARTFNRTLCDIFDDLIYFVFGMIISSNRDSSTDGEFSDLSKANNSMDYIDPYRPSPFCCFRDGYHEVSEIRNGKIANGHPPGLTKNMEEERIVDIRVKQESRLVEGKDERVEVEEVEKREIDTGVKVENLREEGKDKVIPREENTFDEMRVKMENRPFEQKDVLDDRYLKNLNLLANKEKVMKKLNLQTVPEEQTGASDLETARIENEPAYARVIKPATFAKKDLASSKDPEIFI